MASVFISYSRKDERFARQLATALSNRGFDVWIDVEDIPAGMKWSSAIQQGLDTASAMIVVITPESMASTNVEDEWQYFLDQRKPVFPVLLRDAKIHFQLSRVQYIDFLHRPFDAAFTELDTEIVKKGLTPGAPAPRPAGGGGVPPKRNVPTWAWGAGAAALVLLVLLLVATSRGGAPGSPTETASLAASDTLTASVTHTRTRRPILSPEQLTATETAAIAQAETDIMLTDLASTVAANAPAATQAAGQTATADALTATADAFTETPTPNRLQTLVAGRATQMAIAAMTATVLAQTPSATPTQACANAPAPRMTVGDHGIVIPGDLPQRVREAPGLDAAIVTSLPGGTRFIVTDGPLCDQVNGVLWWQITWEGGEGWTVEGQADTYFIEPAPPQ